VPSPTETSPTEAPPTPQDAYGWQLVTLPDGPGAREDHTWTVDPESGRAYLFGGRGGGASNELWIFDLTTDTWTLAGPSGAGPQARWGHTATWVPGTGLVIWSGQNNDGFFGDIWAYEPVANAWRELPSSGDVPPARYGSCASLGPDGRLWISHGFTADTGRFSDTRAYDFSTGEWTDETPDGEVPVERCLHDCYWSPFGRLILYGGQTNGTPALGDIWAYNPQAATWEAGPASNAPARQLYALAHEGPDVFARLVFGGGSIEGGFLDDTWTIVDEDLSLVPDTNSQTRPPGRSGATLIADPTRGGFRGRYLLFGGKDGDGPLADLWEFSASSF
jgi:hypothetical protein